MSMKVFAKGSEKVFSELSPHPVLHALQVADENRLRELDSSEIYLRNLAQPMRP